MTDHALRRDGITKAAGVVSLGILASRVLGFLRDMIIAKLFGAGMAADAFFVAFRIPSVLRELFGEGALSASFIPIFTETLHRSGKEEAWRIGRIAITLLASLLFLVVLLGILLSPLIVRVLAPGFHLYPEKFNLTISLTRITFPYIFFIGMSALLMGMLNSLRHFLAPALAPTMLNLSMIFSALLLSPYIHPPILSLAIGVLLGGAGQMIFQIPGIIKEGARFFPDFQWDDPTIRRIGKLMLPGIMGLALNQANFLVSTFLASFLKEGSVSCLYYGFRLIWLPTSLVGVALGTAALPFLSTSASSGSITEFRRINSVALHFSFFLTLPSMAWLIIFRNPIVTVLFERGLFSPAMTREVTAILFFLCLGIPFYVGDRILVPAFYSLQDTKTPVVISGIAVATDILFSLLLIGPMQVRGLALATSIASFVHFILLLFTLRRKIGPLGASGALKSLSRNLLAILPSILLGCFSMHYFSPLQGSGVAERAALLILELSLVSAAYLGMAFILRSPEALFLVNSLRERHYRRKAPPPPEGGSKKA